DDLTAAGPLVQAIHILGDEGEVGVVFGKAGEGEMTRVRRCGAGQPAAVGIPTPNEAGVAAPAAGRSKGLYGILAPEAGAGRTEGGDAALGRDASASERYGMPGCAQPLEEVGRDRSSRSVVGHKLPHNLRVTAGSSPQRPPAAAQPATRIRA